MSWSRDRLRALAAERGETGVGADAVGTVLLAHERLRGRTEEDYARDRAGKELDALLERQATPLPQEAAREYAGLRQLRAYAADRTLSRAVVQSGAKETVKPSTPEAVKQAERGCHQREAERERD